MSINEVSKTTLRRFSWPYPQGIQLPITTPSGVAGSLAGFEFSAVYFGACVVAIIWFVWLTAQTCTRSGRLSRFILGETEKKIGGLLWCFCAGYSLIKMSSRRHFAHFFVSLALNPDSRTLRHLAHRGRLAFHKRIPRLVPLDRASLFHLLFMVSIFPPALSALCCFWAFPVVGHVRPCLCMTARKGYFPCPVPILPPRCFFRDL